MRARYNMWTMEASGIDVCNAMNEYCGDRVFEVQVSVMPP